LHLWHPRCARRIRAVLEALVGRAHQLLEDEALEASLGSAEEARSFQGSMLVYKRVGGEVMAEYVECRAEPCLSVAEVRDQRITLKLNFMAAGGPEAPVAPVGMDASDLQMLLGKAGQYVLDDLASGNDYAEVSARSHAAGGYPDLWLQWEQRVRSAADQLLVPPPNAWDAGAQHARQQHPAVERLLLLKQLDARSGMRLIQSCTRLLLVPELHANVVGLSCHVRLAAAAHHEADALDNPLGPIAGWSPSDGLLLALAGTPLMCNGHLQFRQVWRKALGFRGLRMEGVSARCGPCGCSGSSNARGFRV